MPFNIGDRVQKVHQPDWIGTVAGPPSVRAGLKYYVVDFGGAMGRQNIPETSIRPFMTKSPVEALASGEIARYDDFQRFVTFYRINKTEALTSNVYSINASRISVYHFQFKPVLKVMNSHSGRILIADEVGLGKTIEAALIYTELSARNPLKRALIVCPAKLTEKWQLELKEKFGHDFRILRGGDFEAMVREMQTDNTVGCHAIVSHNVISSKAVVGLLESARPVFDFIVIDEAHNLRNLGANRAKAGRILSESTLGSFVLLTATPVNLRQEDLANLLNLLDPLEFPDPRHVLGIIDQNQHIVRAQNCMAAVPPQCAEALESLRGVEGSRLVDPAALEGANTRIGNYDAGRGGARQDLIKIQADLAQMNLISHVFNRTRKREVGLLKERKAIAHVVELGVMEARFFNAVMGFLRLIAPLKYPNAVIRHWVLNVPQQRMASSINAMVRHYKRNPERLFTLDDLDLEDDVVLEGELGNMGGMPNLKERVRDLQDLLANWDDVKYPDSKYQKLLHQLQAFRKEEKKHKRPLKVIVFAFFKDTLYYLKEKLEADGFKPLLIVGGDPATVPERSVRIREFRESEVPEVLLMSRVGSEGLDFQFCHIMVNYDLPWNPMELEQRIGRLDRIGQKSDVIQVCNLWIKGSIEEKILKRLYERLHVFRSSIGELEEIMGEITSEIQETFISALESDAHISGKLELIDRALERKTQELTTLNSNIASFIGTESYLEEEINAAFQTKKFVPGGHLYRFLEDFLRHHAPKSRLTYDEAKKKGQLAAGPDLLNLLRDNDLGRLVDKYSAPVDITFDSETAFVSPLLDFINILHPLIEVATRKLASTELPAVHSLALKSGAIKGLTGGCYTYFIFRYLIEGVRPVRELCLVILDKNGRVISKPEASYEFLATMIEEGRNCQKRLPQIAADSLRDFSNQAEEAFVSYLQARKGEVESSNANALEKRRRYVTEFYRNREQNYLKVIEKAKANPGDKGYQRVLPIYEAQLRQNEAQRQAQIEAFDAKKKVVESWSSIAAGLLVVE